jgi:hypothetical protein
MPRVKMKMEVGAEPRKVAILAGLLIVAAALYFTNMDSGPETESGGTRSVTSSLQQALNRNAPAGEVATGGPRPASTAKQTRREFRPKIGAKKGEERNPATIDPALNLELLKKVAEVRIARADRSLFDFGADPAAQVKPKVPEPKIEVKQPRMIGPEPPPPPPPPPVKPPPPPINLKFYGNSLPVKDGQKRVFCMQGEDILIPAEGEVIQKRYKIVRINQNSVVVEDLDYKNQQTLPIEQIPKV